MAQVTTGMRRPTTQGLSSWNSMAINFSASVTRRSSRIWSWSWQGSPRLLRPNSHALLPSPRIGGGAGGRGFSPPQSWPSVGGFSPPPELGEGPGVGAVQVTNDRNVIYLRVSQPVPLGPESDRLAWQLVDACREAR